MSTGEPIEVRAYRLARFHVNLTTYTKTRSWEARGKTMHLPAEIITRMLNRDDPDEILCGHVFEIVPIPLESGGFAFAMRSISHSDVPGSTPDDVPTDEETRVIDFALNQAVLVYLANQAARALRVLGEAN